MNGQVISFAHLSVAYVYYFPVELKLNIVTRALVLGNTAPEDPLCVYKNEKGIQCLTVTDVTAYFRLICQLVMPDAGLELMSNHSIRVYACVLLGEAGKY